MGRYIVKVPDIGEGTTEAEIVKWHVAPGQEIREEDPLVDVMTDTATVEIPAPVGGTVVALNGAVVPRGAWAATALNDGDRIEIIRAMQGG